MAIFTRWGITRHAKSLITKAQARGSKITFTRAKVGDGVWSQDDSIDYADDIKSMKQEFAFSDIRIPDGSPATVVLSVVMHNRGLNGLYYIREMGIFANDPDEGEILYAVAVSDYSATYMPAENGVGLSTIIERVNLEVSNAEKVEINTTGAVVSAEDFLALKSVAEILNNAIKGGITDEILIKTGDGDYELGWKMFRPVWTSKLADFPDVGQVNVLYVDIDSAELWVWKEATETEAANYFLLPLGSEASATLQRQITENKNAINALVLRTKELEKKHKKLQLVVHGESWTEDSSGAKVVYSQEIEIADMTEDSDVHLESYVSSNTLSAQESEMKAIGIFFSFGIAYADAGKMVLKCIGKKPAVDFGIIVEGVTGIEADTNA